jgi:hypothetical protein
MICLTFRLTCARIVHQYPLTIKEIMAHSKKKAVKKFRKVLEQVVAERREPRILLYDLETSLQTVAVFQLGGNDWIQPSNILQERHIICAAWQWLGEDKIHAVSLLDDPARYAADPHDDRHVVEKLHEVMSQADVVVAHYGDSFDNKYVLTRILYHDMEPLPPLQTIDTKKIAKQRFYFNSNGLDYIGQYLKVGKKVPHGAGLWLDILKGGQKAIDAIKKMVVYNKGDVALLREVFLKLRPYIPNYINREMFGHVGCPRCGSAKVQSRGTYYALTRTYRRWQCQGTCKGWFRTLKADVGSASSNRVI